MTMLDKLILRSPSQSLDDLFNLDLSSSNIFIESIFLSSNDLFSECVNIENLSDKDKSKLLISLWKYWIRSCSRCTPFATFAGFTIINVLSEIETNIVIKTTDHHKRHVRLDMNFISSIIQELLKLENISSNTYLYLNNSIYEVGSNYRYVKYKISNGHKVYHLESVEKSEYLEMIFDKARNGVLREDLVNDLIKRVGVSEKAAKEYIDEIYQSQILVSELEPNITGTNPFEVLTYRLSKIPDLNSELVSNVIKLRETLNLKYNSLESFKFLKSEIDKIELYNSNQNDILQVDLELSSVSANIQKEIIDEILSQTDELRFLSRQKKQIDLEEFKLRFLNKYGDEEIQLNIALDADIGVGYGSINEDSVGENQLISDLLFGKFEPINNNQSDQIDEFVLNKYLSYIRNKDSAIEITEEDARYYKYREKDFTFSNSQFLIGNILKKNNTLSKDNFEFFIVGVGGPSAANLLGRFTYASIEIEHYVKNLISIEEAENQNAIYAEIVHLPQARTGNVLLRPNLRNYEIPYVGISGIENSKQILAEDLYIKIINEQIHIFSKSLSKEVIPRLSTAHNFGVNSLPVYKFICDLQSQGLSYPCIWDWGALDKLKHLPRVYYKNIIIKKARWNIKKEDLIKENEKKINASVLDKFIDEYHVPRYVCFVEGDNELLIDLRNQISLTILSEYLMKNNSIIIQEFLFTKQNCIVSDLNGKKYTNEIIIPNIKNTNPNNQKLSHNNFNVSLGKISKYSVNSEWLYFKIYCGNTSAETLLCGVIHDFINLGIKNELFESFFFVRYKDESSHLRLRFYNKDLKKQLLVFTQFNNAIAQALSQGIVSKVILDSYQRELTRYSEKYIEFIEAYFYIDSKCVINFLNLLEGTDTVKYRLIFALIGIDFILDDFGYNIDEKQTLIDQLKYNFFREFGGTALLQKQLNSKYRNYQKDIFSHMNRANDDMNEIFKPLELFLNRSIETKGLIKEHFGSISPTESREYFNTVVPSIIHMYINRLYVSRHRNHELVIYYFLEKYYSSILAINSLKKPF